MSVLLRVTCAPQRLPLLALGAGLAVRDALAAFAPAAELGVKWPNDVVAGPARAKVAGVLVESTIGAAGAAVVVGVGVNVGTRVFPPELAGRATSLALLADGPPPPRAVVLAELLSRLDAVLARVAAHGLGPIAARLAAVDALCGARVRTDAGDVGVARGIDPEGRLVLERADGGGLVRLVAGEVHLTR